jgi:hypothetical protein
MVLQLVHLQMVRGIVSEDVRSFSDLDLKTLVWLDRLDEALAHAHLRQSLHEQIDGIFAIYCAIDEQSGSNFQLYNELLNLVGSLSMEYERVKVLKKMLPVFPLIHDKTEEYEELLNVVLQASKQISDLWRDELLVALAERIVASTQPNLVTRVIAEAITLIENSKYYEHRAWLFSRLAAALTSSIVAMC